MSTPDSPSMIRSVKPAAKGICCFKMNILEQFNVIDVVVLLYWNEVNMSVIDG